MARLVSDDGIPPSASSYTAVDVLIDGKWKLASVRETNLAQPSNYAQLQEFEWLVGKWQVKTDDTTVLSTVRWLPGKSFLERKYTVQQGGLTRSSGLQIIGWDPQAGQVRSWSFDSSGGYGSGYWTPVADGWRINSVGMLADGAPTSAEDYLIRVPQEDNVLGFRSVNRKVGDTQLPDLDEVVLERQPEKP